LLQGARAGQYTKDTGSGGFWTSTISRGSRSSLCPTLRIVIDVRGAEVKEKEKKREGKGAGTRERKRR